MLLFRCFDEGATLPCLLIDIYISMHNSVIGTIRHLEFPRTQDVFICFISLCSYVHDPIIQYCINVSTPPQAAQNPTHVPQLQNRIPIL